MHNPVRVALFTTLVVFGCSAGSGTGKNGSESGGSGGAGTESGGANTNGGASNVAGSSSGGSDAATSGGANSNGDASGNSGSDAGPVVVANPPTKMSLVAPGDDSRIIGVTSDYYAIYETKDGAINAVSLNGGAPIPIAAASYGDVQGRTVLAWSLGAPQKLTSWTSTAGIHTLATGRSLAFYTWAADVAGKKIVVFDEAAQEMLGMDVNLTEQVSLGKTSDGGDCTAVVSFSNDRFVTQTCGLSANVLGKVTSWTAAWKPTVLFDGVATYKPVVNDASGGRVYAKTERTSGDFRLEWVPILGGSPTTLSADAEQFIISPDSTRAVYTSVNVGTVYWTTTTNPAPTAVDHGFSASIIGGIPGFFSPDNAHLIYTNGSVRLTAMPHGNENVLSKNAQTSRILDRGFTADSKFALFRESDGVYAVDVATAVARTLLTNTTLFNTGDYFAIHSSGFFFADAESQRLLYADLSTQAPPKVVLDGMPLVGAGPMVSVTPSRDAFASAVTTGSTPHGIYGGPVP